MIARDMDEVYEKVINGEAKRRIARLEMFDEFEEWHMIMQHYCIVCAGVDRSATDGDVEGGSWLREVSQPYNLQSTT
eukprot:SAG25_NODE_303_length_10153_cov_13.304356_3_plen_77_part_00